VKDRVAVVTGASRGIGLEIVRVIAREGCRVAMVSRSEAALQQAMAEVQAESADLLLPLAADVSDPEQVKRLFQKVTEHWQRVDFLINNAGITRDRLLLRMSGEDWQSVISTNMNGVFYCTREAISLMIKKRFGRIVNVSSVVAHLGNPGQANYCASKAGIEGFTRAVARELASRNITANSVAPGYIDTEMTRSLPPEAREGLLRMIPLGRMGTPADVAEAVRFLLSDQASYITGQVLSVNGGMHMGA
jgi:3-oxoacyl-[acyl-carrier protein] reductase